MIHYADGATPWMFDMSRDILGLLDLAYPGHPWACKVYGDNRGGGFFIYHLGFDGKNYGYNQPNAHKFASASELRAEVLKAGGEVLERSYLARAKWKEEEIRKMDGVPFKDQPLEYQSEEIEKALAKAFPEKQKAEETNGLAKTE